MSIDAFLSREYNERTYHCGHFACDVIEHYCGQSVRDKFARLLLPLRDVKFTLDLRKEFNVLDKPINYCAVMMHTHSLHAHAGVHIDGRVLHLTRTGAKFELLHVVQYLYDKVRFYT